MLTWIQKIVAANDDADEQRSMDDVLCRIFVWISYDRSIAPFSFLAVSRKPFHT